MWHELKSWPESFIANRFGQKKHELRFKDRDFQVGDSLCLREYDPITKEYTGRTDLYTVTYINSFENQCAAWDAAVDDRYCILSIERVLHGYYNGVGYSG